MYIHNHIVQFDSRYDLLLYQIVHFPNFYCHLSKLPLCLLPYSIIIQYWLTITPIGIPTCIGIHITPLFTSILIIWTHSVCTVIEHFPIKCKCSSTSSTIFSKSLLMNIYLPFLLCHCHHLLHILNIQIQ